MGPSPLVPGTSCRVASLPVLQGRLGAPSFSGWDWPWGAGLEDTIPSCLERLGLEPFWPELRVGHEVARSFRRTQRHVDEPPGRPSVGTSQTGRHLASEARTPSRWPDSLPVLGCWAFPSPSFPVPLGLPGRRSFPRSWKSLSGEGKEFPAQWKRPAPLPSSWGCRCGGSQSPELQAPLRLLPVPPGQDGPKSPPAAAGTPRTLGSRTGAGVALGNRGMWDWAKDAGVTWIPECSCRGSSSCLPGPQKGPDTELGVTGIHCAQSKVAHGSDRKGLWVETVPCSGWGLLFAESQALGSEKPVLPPGAWGQGSPSLGTRANLQSNRRTRSSLAVI